MKKNKFAFQSKGIAFGFFLGFIITVVILGFIVAFYMGYLDSFYTMGASSSDKMAVPLP